MVMPGRKYNQISTKYRYGFNGQEKSDDVTSGNYTAQYWEYDSRIGRRWNVDPKQNIYESPYLTFNGNPITNVDPDGDEAKDVIYRDKKKKEIGRKVTKDNYDQYVTVLQGTIDPQTSSTSSDYKEGSITTVYHNRHKQPATTPTQAPSQAPVNTKQQPSQENNSSQKPSTVETIINRTSNSLTAASIGTATLTPTFAAGASEVLKSGMDKQKTVALYLKKNIFIDATLKNNNSLRLPSMKGGAVLKVNNALKVSGPILNVVAAGMTAYNIGKDGKMTVGEGFTAVNTGLQMAFPVYGFAFSVVDLGFSLISDKSLSDRMQGYIDNNVKAEFHFNGTKK
jgi:RHS repeat-associated protein